MRHQVCPICLKFYTQYCRNSFFSKQIGCINGIIGYIGDGYCDDENNNAGCHFDGGDCCGVNVNTQYCNECICYE